MQLISGATYGDDIMTTFTTSRDDVLRRQARHDDCGLMAIAVISAFDDRIKRERRQNQKWH
jgi:hypothetical protein